MLAPPYLLTYLVPTRLCNYSFVHSGDGKLDLLVYDAGSATAPKIYEMSSGGTYTTKSITALAGLASTNLAWKDIDNDGRPDLIDFSGNRVYLNDATQSFAGAACPLSCETARQASPHRSRSPSSRPLTRRVTHARAAVRG